MDKILLFVILNIIFSSCTNNISSLDHHEDEQKTNNVDLILFNKKSVKPYTAKLPSGKKIYFILQPEKNKTLGSMRIENKLGDFERNDLVRVEVINSPESLLVLRSMEDSTILFKGKFSGDSLIGTTLNEDISLVTKRLPYSIYVKEKIRDTSLYNFLSPFLTYPYIQSERNKEFQDKFNLNFEGSVVSHVKLSKSLINDTLGSEYEFTQYANITYLSESILSFEIFSHFYPQRSAHGMMYNNGYTYNIQTGDSITLESLFKKKSGYLKFLSSYCIIQGNKNLEKKGNLGPVMESGLAPEIDNFKNFYLTNNSIVFLYFPYQLGPFAMGAPKIEVPYKLITRYLKDDCVIRTIMKEMKDDK